MAFQHRSTSNSKNVNNERLEFLGDSVLSLIVSNVIFNDFSGQDEGELSKIRSNIIDRDSLNELSVKMGVSDFLIYDKNIRIPDYMKCDLFGNAFEAFIGAIYLDKGYSFTLSFFRRKILNKYLDITQVCKQEKNYKGRLYEYAAKKNYQLSFLVEETGSRDNPVYTAKVMLNGEEKGSGTGLKKKIAEQIASQIAIESIKNNNKED